MTNDQRLLFLGVVGATGYLLYLLAPVLTPFVAAGLLAYIGDPLADRLQNLRLPRALAVLVVFLLTFVVLAGLVLLLVPLVQSQIGALLEVLPRYVEFLEDKVWPQVSGLLGEAAGDADIGLAAMIERFGADAASLGTTVLSSIGRSGGALITGIVNLFLTPVLTFYLLRDWDLIMARLGALVPERNREAVFTLARETDETLGAFLRGQLLVMFALAVLYSSGLALIGLKFALAIGVVSGIVSFVPYLGLFFGIGLAGLTAINSPDGGLLQLGLVVAVFSIAQFIEGSVLTPKLVGDRIGLHPVLVIFAVMAFGLLFGFFGILLALPAAAALAVFVRFTYNRYLREHPEAESYLEAHEPDNGGDRG